MVQRDNKSAECKVRSKDESHGIKLQKHFFFIFLAIHLTKNIMTVAIVYTKPAFFLLLTAPF